MRNIHVADIMTREPLTVKPDASLLDCIKKMSKKRINSVLIVDKKKLIGLISSRDVFWALTKKSQGDLKDIKAMDISPKKLATIKPSEDVKFAWEKMKKFKFERLPVIHEGNLVGLITLKDILNFHPEMYPELEEFEKIKERTAKLKRVKSKERASMTEGICEECGNHDLLYRFNGRLICESCRDSL